MRRCRAAATGLTVAAALAGAPAAGAALVTAEPELTPRFQTGTSDYVTRCSSGEKVRFHVAAPDGTRVGVDGASPRAGSFDRGVALRSGEAVGVVVVRGEQRRRYHVRCLPRSFPRWSFERFRSPQAQWIVLAPQNGAHPSSHYVTIVNARGTPVWWKRTAVIPFNHVLLPDGELAWARWYEDPFGMRPQDAWEIHRLDGTLVRRLRTIASPTDLHDAQPMANGDWLLVTYRVRRGVDLRPYGGPKDGAVVDGEIQELNPSGELVWSWSSKRRVSPAEDTRWRGGLTQLPDGTKAFDYFHLNSVQVDGDGLIVSSRHTDAVYRIDGASGRVVWKLGGTHRKTSLKVIGDDRPIPLSGQHDARLLPDGTLTLFDNHVPGAPRAVRFRIDPVKRTARLLEQVTEPSLVWSPAEGSARKLPGGHWVVSWGATQLVSERTASDKPVWRLTLAKGQNYRAEALPPGQLAAATLRRAMDAMHPRP